MDNSVRHGRQTLKITCIPVEIDADRTLQSTAHSYSARTRPASKVGDHSFMHVPATHCLIE